MSEELTDEQSHYEISLTAGQAFVAFVLLLLSLAASFAFGLMIGKGQADDRLVVRKEPSVVTEAAAMPKKSGGKIVELGVADEDFKAQTDTTGTVAAPTATDTTVSTPVITEGATAPQPEPVQPRIVETKPFPPTPAQARAPEPKSAVSPASAPRSGAVFAQLLSTSDQKTAETLAARVINAGFRSAWVERGSNEKGPIFRVRVKFDSEAEARAAEARLRDFSHDVWITK